MPTSGAYYPPLLLFCLMSVASLSAQEGKLEQIYLPVIDVDSSGSGFVLTVEGYRAGMKEGRHFIRYGREEEGIEEIRIDRLIHRDRSAARLQVSSSIDLGSVISPLLLVDFEVDTSGISPLRRAALVGVYLGTEVESLITVDEAIDGVEDESGIVRELLGHIVATGEYINLDPSSDPELTAPISFGNMAGTSLADALEAADSNSLNRAIEFFLAYPERFRGTYTPVVSAYAWWVAYGGPIAPHQIYRELRRAGNNAELNRLFEKFRSDVPEYDYLDRWITEAESLGSHGKIPEAMTMIEIALRGAEYFDRRIDLGWGWFVLGRLHDMDDKLDSAMHAYQRSIEVFEQADDSVGLAWGLNNAGSLSLRLNEPESGVEQLLRSITIKEMLISRGSGRVTRESLAQSVGSYGGALAELGNVIEGIHAYSRAADLYSGDGFDATAGYYHHQIALLYRSRNETELERRHLDSAIGLYRNAGDLEAEADILDEIAYSWSVEGEFERAIELYTEASDLHRRSGEIDDAGFSMANVGQSWWSLGDLHAAEGAHREAIVLREEAGNGRGAAYSWTKLAIMFYENGDPARAREALERAEELYRREGAPLDLAGVAVVRGDFLAKYGSATSTVESYLSAVRQYVSAGSPADAAEALATLGDFYLDRNELSEAEETYSRSRRLAIESGDSTAAYRGATGLGLVSWREGRYDDAGGWLREAHRLAEIRGNRDDVAWVLMNVGQVDLGRGRTTDARKVFLRARAIYESTGNHDGEIDVRLKVGNLYVEAGEFDSAMSEFNNAALIAEDAGRRGRLPDVYSARAGLYLLLGEFDEALEADSLSLWLSTEAENKWGVAGAHVGLGNTWNTMGEYRRSYAAYESADSIYRVLGDELARGTPLNNMGTIWFFQGDLERALDHFNTALSILRNHNVYSEFLAIVVSNIGEVYFEQGRLGEAEEWLASGIEIADSVGARRILASGLTILTKVLRDQGRIDEGIVVATEAATLSDDIGEIEQRAEIHGVRGDLLLSDGREREGETELLLGISLARSIGSWRYLWRPLYRLAGLREEEGRIGEAVTLLEEAVDAIEHTRERIVGGDEALRVFSAGKERIRVYEDLVKLLIESGEIERGLAYLERSNSEDLRSRFTPQSDEQSASSGGVLQTGRRMKAKVDLLAERIAREQAVGKVSDAKLSGLREVYSVAESEYIGFVNETIREEPGLRSYFSSTVNPVELRSRKSMIPDGTVVLSFLPGENSLFTFVATRDTVIARVVPVGRVELIRTVADLHARLSLPPGSARRIDSPASVNEAAAQLWSWLIEPISDRIGDQSHIAIIPSGILGLVPFSMLSPSGGRSLGEYGATFQISDLGLFLSEESTIGERKIALFANPDGSLPYSEKEAAGIRDLYPGSLLLTGKDATETTAKNVPAEYSVLHFATHGTLDYGNVDQSWLTLAPDVASGEDGRLTLSEVWGMTNLSECRMVTLSACNTAVGAEVVEGWPVNPANAFLQVGVPSVVATLWRVDDEATARFMVEFYRNLRTTGAAEALRATRKALRADLRFSDPYYWAPFVLLGDWR